MKCDEAQASLSASFDDRVADGDGASGQAALDIHVATCASCTAFVETAQRVRHHLRTAPAADPPDIASAVLARIHRDPATGQPSRRRRALPAAAVFVAAAAAAAVFVGISDDQPTGVAAADLPERVAAAQHQVESLSARVTVVETGWHPDVAERRFEGSLRYDAPESLALSLRDRSNYPDTTWRPNETHLVVDERTWWARGPADCPSAAQPDCTPTTPVTRVVTGREPFSESAPAPLDLIMPVQSFSLAGTAAALPAAAVDGRETLGVQTTVAQVGPLLAGFRVAGNLRFLHPADPVELRLDRETLVPLRLVVRAAAGPDRRRWAESRGYPDQPGDAVLDVTLTDLEVNGDLEGDAFPAPPHGGSTTDSGFADRPVSADEVPAPARLPSGLRRYRSGVVDTPEGPAVATRTWTDGRAWLAVSATGEWPGGRLLGDLGTIVRPIDLGAGGQGYLSEDGRSIGLHTPETDLVVAGSVTRDQLEEVASTLGVVGEPVPATWDEAATADPATARDAIEPFLLPEDQSGFAPPALRVDGPAVSASFAGPGNRSFALVQVPAFKLRPPLDTADVVAVTVRGTPGRFSPERGELEWFEDEILYSLRSPSLSRADLLAIAARLTPQ